MSDVLRHAAAIGNGIPFLPRVCGRARALPQNAVAALSFAAFIAAWTTHGAIVEGDKVLHFDLLEAYAWGKEFQLGYNQHGPFWAWIAGAWFFIFPATNTSFVLLEALNAALGLLGAWILARQFANGSMRHAAALLLIATPFYTVMAFKFNANTIFLSLWPWTLLFFIRSLDPKGYRDACLFGAMAAACVLSKYYAVILLATCALALPFHPSFPRYFISWSPWISAAVFLALVSPHLMWALTSHAPPITYAMSLTGKGWLFTLSHAGGFIWGIVTAFAGVALLITLAWIFSRGSNTESGTARLPQWQIRFLSILVLSPPLLTLISALAFQLKIVTIMAVGTLPLLPLLLMQIPRLLDARRCCQIAGAAAVTITLLAAVAAPLERAAAFRKNSPSITEPIRELAAQATARWHDETGRDLRYVGGMARFASGIAFYSGDHPSSLVDLTYAKALWVTPEKIAKGGLLIACASDDAVCLERAAGFVTAQTKIFLMRLSRKVGVRQMPEMAFTVYVVPPAIA